MINQNSEEQLNITEVMFMYPIGKKLKKEPTLRGLRKKYSMYIIPICVEIKTRFVIAGYLVREDEHNFYITLAISQCSEKDNYVKKVGKAKALGRLKASSMQEKMHVSIEKSKLKNSKSKSEAFILACNAALQSRGYENCSYPVKKKKINSRVQEQGL